MTKAIVFDLESTGTDKSKDRIIEFGAFTFDWDIVKKAKSFKDIEPFIIDKVKMFFLPDGGEEVSIGAYAKHRLDREALKDFPGFGTFAEDCVKLFESCDIVLGYNHMSFDIPMLSAELRRYGKSIDWSSKTFYDSFKTEVERNSNKLEAVYERYTGKSMENSGLDAHDAFSDIIATTEVFLGQNKEEDVAPQPFVTDDGFLTIGEFEGKDTVIFAQGKYYGIPLREVVKSDMGYIRWVLSADFSARTKSIINKCVEIYNMKLN